MDNRRFLLFFLITFVALQLYFSLVKPPEPANGNQQQATGATPTAGELTSRGASPELAVAASAEVQQYPDLPPVVVETGVYRVEFTNRGARPMRWEITDPTYGHRTESGEMAQPEIITQLPGAVGLHPEELPLEVDLAGWPRSEDFNKVNWQLVQAPAPDPETGAVSLAFESPEMGGLVLRKEFTFYQPREDGEVGGHAGGYLNDFRLVIRNASTQRVALNDAAVGLRLTWGPGIGPYEPVGFYNQRAPLALLDGDTWYSTPRAGAAREVATSDPQGIS
jgi:hypothetical protein